MGRHNEKTFKFQKKGFPLEHWYGGMCAISTINPEEVGPPAVRGFLIFFLCWPSHLRFESHEIHRPQTTPIFGLVQYPPPKLSYLLLYRGSNATAQIPRKLSSFALCLVLQGMHPLERYALPRTPSESQLPLARTCFWSELLNLTGRCFHQGWSTKQSAKEESFWGMWAVAFDPWYSRR